MHRVPRRAERAPAGILPVVVLTLVAALLGACGAAASPAATPAPTAASTPTPAFTPAPTAGATPSPAATPPPTTPSPRPTAALILRVTNEGGFIAPSASLGALPAVSVYADGRIITPADPAPGAPDAAIPGASVRTLGPAAVDAIRSAIHAAGLDRPGGPAGGPVGIPGDAGSDVFSVIVDGRPVTTRVAAGGPGPGRPGQASSPALDLLARLTDPTDGWGGPAPSAVPYVADGYRVFVAPGGQGGEPSASPAAIAWPLATPLAAFGVPANPDRGVTGLRMGVALGADARALADALATTSRTTTFTSAGAPFTLWVRPLLPDELP